MTDTLALAAEVVSEARGWLIDCGYPGVRGMSDADALRTVARHWDGGFRGFIAADPDWQPGAVRTALSGRYGCDLAAWLWAR